ncbi:hypothetical protein [Streptomyces sp. Je 1-332]|uniref:hypothetical protein n=1 Tax=Streptomyces sp. Je 1-332 TaxID=3231270 RepID=UPI003459AA9A
MAVNALRDVSRGVHPKALTDHGLGAAAANLVTHAALPVTVDVQLPQCLPVPVETTAYFVIAETLANAALANEVLANATKYSEATHAEVHSRLRENHLRLAARSGALAKARCHDPGHGRLYGEQ